ncbi:aspartate-semialdehyde dehydrogenase : Aspartate-semialdehyde dehydrogenase OS=Singulisphaera acidiphila (strain ATCC BAA-1392 / DSM 18658 / VKM B-2454 / MOB10) GN=asd PE=3 SV=1: Semialdhyde_dh: Semialdhyde_dhC [Gemmataceae bacterium]|nr:aspartate-semialdehyde dehydrogenase : Aspartate-semialdehyde dehydrogenase OS=Singulisphaera acidiphila (strain ATCC BAA-1392 / DSM 18658 / VKM B-2454 / MOB10) GN=asd PE=3 SV=1: Semialdhyde_dh: Semialdhyde_dhC [Gemmataceae bacterium]VTT99754.1 aspartate-semialdehyde dehydrogenase : Aspartate-semialdehyde dehydrogenase OS=Singulisphaera acidiphila (strain ATCC BAA-1392 / DSM 18658 / VKM B-2454 / MOB10) GN=asd PE=3 SV=1: Semialdhyde_dh: Semialdhyde_dhC [Gemmataceae bacterium]
MSVNVAVVGATGAVGDLIRKVLVERAFPVKTIKFLASEKSAGKTVEFAGKLYTVEPIRAEAFAGVQIVLSSTPSSVSKEFSPIAAKAGAIVIDNSSAWRMDPDCPLVVPEVNGDQLHHIKKGIVANPNCVAIPLCVALKPLHDLGRVKRIVVATYQSSSGKGATGLTDFNAQVAAWGAGKPVPAPTAHKAQLAGNVITLDWTLDPNGFTEEENKVVNETKKIMGDPTIGVCPTCVRVPVKVAHSEAVTVEFHNPVSVADAKAALAKAPGVVFMDETKDGKFPQPLHAEGSDHTFVGRVRQDPSNPNALCLWVVSDNLRKGAATNAVQCAQELVRRGIVK